MRNLEWIIKELVNEVKNLDKVNSNDIIYRYDPILEEYNIVHGLQDLINEDDDFAYTFGTLISDYLFSKGYFEVNIFEDKQLLEKYSSSISISKQTKQEWDESFVKINSSLNELKVDSKLLGIAA